MRLPHALSRNTAENRVPGAVLGRFSGYRNGENRVSAGGKPPGPPDLGFFGQPPRARFLEKNWLTLPCEIFREKSANPQT